MWRGAVFITCAVALAACGASPEPATESRLELRPCVLEFFLGTFERELPAECGTLSVPEDRSKQGGRQIGVRVTVLRGATKGGAVFMLAGGPGQAGRSMIAAAESWLRPLRTSMDIVLVDQRGSEEGGPLACPAAIEPDAARAFGHVLYPDVLKACRDAFAGRIDATKYTTEDAAADLDDVRATLGYERISLYGGSYGTRLGQAYIRRYPDRVRSAVLDGVVPLDLNVPLTMAKSLQRAIERVVYADKTTGAAFTSLLERFDGRPINATVMLPDGRPVPVRMSRHDFLYAVRGILYQPTSADRLPEWIRESARTGRVDVFAQQYWRRARHMQATLAHGLHLSVDCAEDVPFSSDEDIRRETGGTLIGRWLYDEYANACRLWPSTPVPDDWRTPVTAAVPVLLLSGELDPVTPPEFGERVARSLPRSRHIVVPGGAHGSGAGCPLPAVLHALGEGTLDRLPNVCR